MKKEKEQIQNIEIDKNQNKIDFLRNIFGENGSSNGYNPMDLETSKLILSIIQDYENLGSTTNLTDEQIEDISDAESVNLIFNSPLITTFIDSFRIHRRSLSKEPKNLLEILTGFVGREINQKMDFMKEYLGNRFNG